MDVATQTLVRIRAGGRCEYCRLPQAAARFLAFHIEHIQAKQHIADDSLENLALACPDCNRYKGPNLTTLDKQTRELVRLFHPRQDIWDEHFEYDGALILGRTAIGQATVSLLQFNLEERLEMRAELQNSGICSRQTTVPEVKRDDGYLRGFGFPKSIMLISTG